MVGAGGEPQLPFAARLDVRWASAVLDLPGAGDGGHGGLCAAAAQGAVRAAGAIEGVIADLNNRLGRQPDNRLKIAVSIHGGHAAIGEIGASEPPTLMAIGDAIDVANDLRKAAAERGKAFAISQAVYTEAALSPVAEDKITVGSEPATIVFLSDAAPIP